MIKIQCSICGKLIQHIPSNYDLTITTNINCDKCLDDATRLNYLKGQNDTLKKQMPSHSANCEGQCGSHGGGCTTCKEKH